jgi:hypothetical protein
MTYHDHRSAFCHLCNTNHDKVVAKYATGKINNNNNNNIIGVLIYTKVRSVHMLWCFHCPANQQSMAARGSQYCGLFGTWARKRLRV